MDWVDHLINHIPELLMYVVPGFLSLRIRETYGPQKRQSEFNTVLYCFLYSFIVQIPYALLKFILVSIFPCMSSWAIKGVIKIVVFLVLGILLGLALVKLPKSSFGDTVRKVFNKHAIHDDPWTKTMVNDDGAYAYVYLKNGFVYYGILKNYDLDPDEPQKEIVLTEYKSFVRKEKEISTSNDVLIEFKPKHTKKDKVLLKYEDIISVEVMPSGEPEENHDE